MPLSPEMERLKRAAGSDATEEAGVLADATAELESTAAAVAAYAAFSRTAGIDPTAVVTAPEATAQAFSRELSDLKAAASARPQAPNAEVLHERRLRVNSAVDGLATKGWPKAFCDRIKSLLTGTGDKPNAVMLSRDAGAEDVGAMEFVKALNDMGGPPPPTGSFAGGREAPRQSPGNGQQTPEQLREEGRQAAEKSQREQLERMGVAVK